MLRRFTLAAATFSYFLCAYSYAQEDASQKSAQKAAEEILHAFANQKFRHVWTDLVSEWGHKNWLEDSFISQNAIQRPTLGSLTNLSIVSRNHYTHDPTYNVDGDFYTITFKSTYTSGQFYENVVVMRDSDGQYRMAGIWGAPVPKE
jgi:hypothetical protein